MQCRIYIAGQNRRFDPSDARLSPFRVSVAVGVSDAASVLKSPFPVQVSGPETGPKLSGKGSPIVSAGEGEQEPAVADDGGLSVATGARSSYKCTGTLRSRRGEALVSVLPVPRRQSPFDRRRCGSSSQCLAEGASLSAAIDVNARENLLFRRLSRPRASARAAAVAAATGTERTRVYTRAIAERAKNKS